MTYPEDARTRPQDVRTGPPPSYPRLAARTMNFRLGAPRAFTPAPDGSRVAFLRSPSGTDRRTRLWVYDVETGTERIVADPTVLLDSGQHGEELSPAERARRERTREGAAGVVGYATDREVRLAAFALSSRAWLADLVTGRVRELATATPVLDPRPDPTGTHVAYVAGGALRVVTLASGDDRALAEPDPDTDLDTVCWGTVTWGTAEFIAAEEMDRTRGFWWSPDGGCLLAARVDESPVPVWHIADPANPGTEPRAVRYPAAGTGNAEVSLWRVGLDGTRHEIGWDRATFPYLVDVSWTPHGPPLLSVRTRDQRTARVLEVDVDRGATRVVREVTDDAWVEIVSGVPRWLPDGRLLTTVDEPGTRRLAYDGEPVTPDGVQVGAVLDVDGAVDGAGVLIAATTEPTESHLARVGLDGTLTWLTREPGVYGGRASGDLLLVTKQALDRDGVQVEVRRGGDTAREPVGAIESRQEAPPLTPRVELLRLGDRGLATAVLFPRDHVPGTRRLPLLLAPYGGPHAQRVVAARAAFIDSQWLADQGFCVVVADGRGTPSRGPAWERQILNDFAGTLDDQVEVVAEIARRYPDDVDATRVGIRGWSYGGYLSALAVLRRPDVFRAAVAGAPVTDWRLYDTCYTERYLGHPDEQPEVYERNSLLTLAESPLPEGSRHPALLIIHGLADDNVVAAHSLRLSAALLAAGRPHAVLPLSGVTHMTPQEVVAENRLLLELRFLREALSS